MQWKERFFTVQFPGGRTTTSNIGLEILYTSFQFEISDTFSTVKPMANLAPQKNSLFDCSPFLDNIFQNTVQSANKGKYLLKSGNISLVRDTHNVK